LRKLLEALVQDDPGGRLDQSQMRERLREVPQVAAGGGVEFLGVEAEWRRFAQQALEQAAVTTVG
jgi:hypothetical protein